MVTRYRLLVLLLPGLVACGRLLDIPPEATMTFNFDQSSEGWENVPCAPEDCPLAVEVTGIQPGEVDGHKVLSGNIAFTATGQIAEVQHNFASAIDLRGKNVSASIKVTGLNDSLPMAPANLWLFAKSILLPPNDYVGGVARKIAGQNEWFSISLSRDLPDPIYAIGIHIETGTDIPAAAVWAPTRLYVDTVEIR